MNAEITVKFRINNICDEEHLRKMYPREHFTRVQTVEKVTRLCVHEEGLMGVIDYSTQEIIEVREVK